MGQGPDELSPREIVVRPVRTDVDDSTLDPATREARFPADVDNPDDPELASAREDIERTRAEMTSTIDAIQDRLDPEVLSEQAKDTAHDVTDYAIREAKEAAREITDHAIAQARETVQDLTGQAQAALREATIGKVESMARSATETAGGWRQSVFDTIKANPMPAALVGLGLGWMLLNRPSSSSSDRPSGQTGYSPPRYGSDVYGGYGGYGSYGTGTSYVPGASQSGSSGAGSAQQAVGRVTDRTQQKAGQVVGQVQDTAGQVADQVQDTAGQVMDQVQETSGQVVEQVQQQAARAQSFLQQQLEDNPLVVGAVALAIGGVLAATVPSTSREDELLGETRDRLVGTAAELTQDTMQRVGRVVDEAQSAAKEEAREQSLLPNEGGATRSS